MPCELLDGFSLLVQAGLGLCSFSSLALKRHQEVPQRKLRIWLFDTSKQAVSAGLLHILNMAFAFVVGRTHAGSDPCVVYAVNLFVDVVLGTMLSYYMLRAMEHVLLATAASCCCPLTLRNCAATGTYGSPPQLRRWAAQMSLWVLVVCMTKLICVCLTSTLPFLQPVGAFVLSPLALHPRAELVVVMLVVPLLFNIVQLWIQVLPHPSHAPPCGMTPMH